MYGQSNMRAAPRLLALLLVTITALLTTTTTSLQAQVPTPPTGTQPSPPPAQKQQTSPSAKDQPPPLKPADVALPEISRLQTSLSDAVVRTEKAIERLRNDPGELSKLRQELEERLQEIQGLQARTAAQMASITDQLTKIGPVPPSTETPEPANITKERVRIQNLASKFSAITKALDLANTRSQQLIARINALRQAIFTRHLLQRSPGIFTPNFWTDISAALPRTGKQIYAMLSDVGQAFTQHWLKLLLIVPLVLLLSLLLIISRSRVLGILAPQQPTPPPFHLRACTTLAYALILAAAPTLIILLAYLVLHGLAVVPNYLASLLQTATLATLTFVAAYAAVSALLYPRNEYSRIVRTPGRTAQQLFPLVLLTVFMFLLDIVLIELANALYLPPTVTSAVRLSTNLAIILPLLSIVPLEFPTLSRAAERPHILHPLWIKGPLLLATIAAAIATIIGYHTLANFILGQFLLIATIATVSVILHHSLRSYFDYPTPALPSTEAAPATAEQDLDTQARRHQLLTGLLLPVVDTLLALAALPLILLTWGFTPSDLQSGLQAAIFGFEVGKVRISLARIILAIALFTGIIVVTRFAQRTIRKWAESGTSPDTGVANSVQTFIGYLGTVIAGLAALSYAGFDITNIAIVAGALSVGIGFGLQSIVNNFVSGLIMLFERPVKVGDWVIVNGNEGTIRKISVRATEIETFDRSSIIVPNSEFITGAITNWTHRNALGRGIIKIGVSYKADPEQVKEILLNVASQSKLVLTHPAPLVVFEDFGTSSLDFSLRVYLADVTKRLSALTELRMEIFRAIKEAGIEIPYPADRCPHP